jgi:hypothetical protein
MRLPVCFHEHRIISIVAENCIDGLQVWTVSVTRDLDPFGKTATKIAYKVKGVINVATANECGDQ